MTSPIRVGVARRDTVGSGIRAVMNAIRMKTAACVTADTPNAPPNERRIT
jgi:hypothetical protein